MSALAQYAELARAAARAILAKRVGTPEHNAWAKADILSRLHDAQRSVVGMVFAFVRYIAGECSRRAGKTHLAAALVILKLLEAQRGQEVVFCAPTLARGKELIWGELERMLDEYGLTPEAGWKRTAASGKLRTPSGAIFRIVGLDNKKQVGKISRGGNTVLFITDETQEFPHLLEALLIAAGPALAQTRGCFLALGTPTHNESDYWAAVCDGAAGFVRVHWTLRDNPFLGRDPDELLAEERERNGWAETHPTYVREYLGRRCKDPSQLVLEFDVANECDVITGYRPDAYTIDLATPEQRKKFERENAGWRYEGWRHFIGIDFGLGDATAFVVLAAPAHGRDVYVVHFEQASGLTWDDVADRAKLLCDVFAPQGLVGDSASGGAQFVKTFNVRYSAPLKIQARSASKHDKPASIAVMNTELRTRRMRVLRNDGASVALRMGSLLKGADEAKCGTIRLVKEASALQWADAARSKILEGVAFPEDGFDGWRYAFNDFWAFVHEEKPVTEDDDVRRIRERNEREQQRQAMTRAQRAR